MSDDEFDEGYESVEDTSIDQPIESTFKSEIDSVNSSYNNYYKNEKTTKPFLTKFEKAKVLGTRSEMIANGAIALVNVPSHVNNTYDIAKMEFEQKKIPLIIRRHLPNGNIELWRLSDLVSV
jgi:DNA-directed RNA polymerase I, II, and III subunit RPABC2|tara:strand:- start:883 stop:1248 length:366 start_codon:yes stop_codon:yes gene_type:complete